MKVKIFHNPRCSKSRQTLELLREQGIEPEIVEYLKNPPTAEELEEILQMLDIEPRGLMRKKEPEYKATGMNDESLDRQALIEGMVNTPKLIERPVVIANGKAAQNPFSIWTVNRVRHDFQKRYLFSNIPEEKGNFTHICLSSPINAQ